MPESSKPSAIRYETHGHKIIIDISVLTVLLLFPLFSTYAYEGASAYSLEKEDYLFKIKAIRSAAKAPIKTDPMKTTKNIPNDANTSLVKLSFGFISLNDLYMTIAIASLNILSPKIIAYRSWSASIYLNIASTETGSVALMRLPKAKASFQVKG